MLVCAGVQRMLTCKVPYRYGYNWQESEAEKNLLRTHTTAVSSRMLYRLAQSGFKPAKYFSVDRVFRNEDIDRTHLAEFHQIEGLICDRGLTLGDLIGTLHTFFERLGLKKLRFKPAYNPYTEPSMEIFRCGAGASSSPPVHATHLLLLLWSVSASFSVHAIFVTITICFDDMHHCL